MKKCYIAGKIGGLEENVYKPLFEQAKKEVTAMGMEPVSPVDLPHLHDRSYSSYMREDLTEMLKCDCVYALRNWRHSPGAKEELENALFVGLDIIQQK